MLMRLFGSPIIGDILSPLLVGSRRLLRRRMKRVYDRHSWVMDEKRVDARHIPLRTRGAHRAIIRTVRRWDAERVSRDAHLMTRPTLIVWGENDREVSLETAGAFTGKFRIRVWWFFASVAICRMKSIRRSL